VLVPPMIATAAGAVLRDEGCEPMLSWRDHDLSDQFSSAIGELIKNEHPGALATDECVR